MPAYGAITPRSIYPGDAIPLVNNAATDTGITTTMSVAMAQVPGTPTMLALHNTSGQTATVQVCWHDVAADYQALTNKDTGLAITVATASSVVFSCIGPWVRCTLAAAPTAGSLVLTR